MTVYHGQENWSVKILQIYSRSVERRMFGARMFVKGKAEVEDEMSIVAIFDFEYTGSPDEDPRKLMDYLRSQALRIRLKRAEDNAQTLQTFIEGMVAREKLESTDVS